MQMFNPSISFLRIFSMLLIIFTHVLTWKGINSFQVSTIGVSEFLLISGFLYGEKSIPNKRVWIIGRIKKILVPFWILSMFLVIVLLFKGDYSSAIGTFFESLFDLQGIHASLKIPFFIGNTHVSGISHCWFLTTIVLCYFFMVLLKNTKLEQAIDCNMKKSLLLLFLIQLGLCFVFCVIGNYVAFFLGYFLSRKFRLTYLSKNSAFISLTLVTVFVFVIRIVMRCYADGSVVYDWFISHFSANLCALWFFVFVAKIFECCKGFAKNIESSKVWKNMRHHQHVWKHLGSLAR